MIKNTYELNNIQKDSANFSGKFNAHSPVAEVFSAMVNGKEMPAQLGKKADAAVEYIKKLGTRAENGDGTAIAELNTLRRFTIEAPVMEQVKLLGIFGTYQALDYDDTVEREVVKYTGERSREQAALGDVIDGSARTVERYTVPTFTISGGYAVDYRRVALGDMAKENIGLNQVKTDIVNRALLAIVTRIYDAISKATGVKYMLEANTLTKTAVDNVIGKVRPWGKTTVVGEYGIISQFNNWIGYTNAVSNPTVSGISEAAMNEIIAKGILSNYNGSTLVEMPNPYDVYAPLVTGADGEVNFDKLLPPGLAYVIPTGVQSPIATWTRGGLTSFSGNNVKNGKVETRFDLEVACDIAKGQEYKIATIYDGTLGGLDGVTVTP